MSSNDRSQPSLFDPVAAPGTAHSGEKKEAAQSVASPVAARKPAPRRKSRPDGQQKAPSSVAVMGKPAPAFGVGVAGYLSVADLARHFSVSVPTIWRWAKQVPGFPKPVVLSPGTTRWRLADLAAFEQTLGSGS
jgi:predicted DNA-binding transcriptional regulator AlpA